MKALFRYFDGYRRQLVLGPLFKLTEAVLELFVPLLMANIIDVGIKNGNVKYVVTHGLFMLGLGAVGLACALTCQYFAAVCAQGISVLTVAERLNPPELFDAFLKLRTDVGMEIIGVSPGDSVFHSLLEQAKGRKNLVIPLLADRDISGTGIEVEFGTKPALVAAGPAALARALNAPLIAGVVSDVDASGSPEFVRLEVTENLYDPQVKDDDVPELTQKWVTALLPILQRRIRKWHMMQAVFIEDLDPERLARARKRAAQKGE